MGRNNSHEQPTRLDKMENWFRNQPMFSVVILAGVIVIGTSELFNHGYDLLTKTGVIKENTLRLATDNAKGELSRKLIELAWRRLFWSRNFVLRVYLDRPSAELDYSWNKHLDTVDEWSSDYMVNLNGMEEYYPHSKKACQFEAIHKGFLEIEDLLFALRMKKPDEKDREASKKSTMERIDALNTHLYFFVLNRKDKPEAPHPTKGDDDFAACSADK